VRKLTRQDVKLDRRISLRRPAPPEEIVEAAIGLL
jgi:hypothetical protein